MPWLRLTLETTADQVDSLTGFLQQFDATAISLTPVSAEPIYGGVGNEPEVWQRTSVSALLDSETDLDILIACLRNRIGTENLFSHHVEPVLDREWTEAWKKEHGPIRFGHKLSICPSWLPSPGDTDYTVILDPGLAFGTGTHATTALCLDWLAGNEFRNKLVIDYGCGSGILSLAAARLGAAMTYAVDIDPQALLATQANADKNGLAEQLIILSPDQANLPQADILIANILLNPLLELAPVFSKLVKRGGQIVLSGILAGQVQDCLDSYARWFTMDQPEFRDEWAILHGSR